MYTLINKISSEVSLKENANATYKYSSTQIQIPNNIAEKILAFSLAIPDEKIYTDPEDPSMGRELEPHITIKYGLETTDSTEIENLVTKETQPIKVTLKTASLFEPKDKPYDVLKIDVDSEQLKKLHGIFSALPNSDTHPSYVPHLTIAYIKKGEGAEYVGAKDFDDTSFEVDFFYFKGSDNSSTKIELAVVPYNNENMNKALNQFLEEPETKETSEILKGQNPVPFMTPWQ